MHPHSKIDDKPQTLVGVSFQDAFRAQEFMSAASRLASRHSLQVHDAVVVAKDENGHTRVVETIDPQPGRAALSGAMWTGLLGLLLLGPVGWLAGGVIGAGAGAVAAKAVDLGVPDEWVAWFRDAVQPGTTTVVLLLTDVKMDALVEEAKRFVGAELIYANLDPISFDRVLAAFGGSPRSADDARNGVASNDGASNDGASNEGASNDGASNDGAPNDGAPNDDAPDAGALHATAPADSADAAAASHPGAPEPTGD